MTLVHGFLGITSQVQGLHLTDLCTQNKYNTALWKHKKQRSYFSRKVFSRQ